MTIYTVPDNPDNPEQAALELIARLPGTILASDTFDTQVLRSHVAVYMKPPSRARAGRTQNTPPPRYASTSPNARTPPTGCSTVSATLWLAPTT